MEKGVLAAEGDKDDFAPEGGEGDFGAEGGHADGESDYGAEGGYANGGESDSRAEEGRGDVWGDVDEALSAVGSEDCNEADSRILRGLKTRVLLLHHRHQMHRCGRRVCLVYVYHLEYHCVQLRVYHKFGGYSALY